MRILMLTQYFALETGATSIRLGAIIRGLRRHQVELVNVPPAAVPALNRRAAVGLCTLRDGAIAATVRLIRTLNAMAAGAPVVHAGHGEGADLVCPGRRSWRGSSRSCWPAARRGGMPPACALREPPCVEP